MTKKSHENAVWEGFVDRNSDERFAEVSFRGHEGTIYEQENVFIKIPFQTSWSVIFDKFQKLQPNRHQF